MEDEDTALALYEASVTALITAARDNPTSDSLRWLDPQQVPRRNHAHAPALI